LALCPLVFAALVVGLFAQSDARQNILFLHSYHKADWSDNLMRGYQSVLGSRPRLDAHTEYMDTKKLNAPEYLGMLADMYRMKYSKLRFDVVLTSDDDAFQFALERQDSLFKGAPVVFCGVNHYDPQDLVRHPNATGVVERGDFEETLALAFRLRPGTREVLVVCDTTNTGLVNLAGFEKAMRDEHPAVKYITLQDLSLTMLEYRLAQASADSFVFFISFWMDEAGRQVTPAELGEVFKGCPVPVFGRSEWMIGLGMLGGKCVTGFSQGEAAARLAGRVLDGESASDIPVILESPNQFLFDHGQLRRFAIPESALPENSVVFNKPLSVYEDHKVVIWTFITAFLLLLTMVSILGYDVDRRRRVEKSLRESEERYRRFIEESRDGIVVAALDGSIREVNSRFCSMLGYTADQLVEMSIPEVHPEDFRDAARQFFAQCVDEGAVRFQGALLRADGDRVEADVSASLIQLQGGILMGIVRDVTERKRDELRLARLATAVEQAAEDIMLTDADGVIQYVNPAFERVTGWTAAEVLGKTPRLLKSGRHDDAFYRDLWGTIRSGRVWTGILLNRRKDGSIIEEEANISPILDGSGGIAGFVSVCRDVSQQRSLESQLRQAQKLEAIGTLAGGIAHDFNNVLQAIMGYADLIVDISAEGSQIRQSAAQISSAGKRAAQLVGQILTFSRQTEQSRQPLLMQPVIKETIKFLRGSLPSTIEIRQQIDPDCRPVRGDATQIHQVLMNLSANAFHAMRQKGGALTISLDEVELGEAQASMLPDMKSGPHVRLEVSDTGHGMDPDVRERIFEPFFTTKPPGEGTGMGLATVHGVVKAHEGAITVQSRLGQGSRFTVLLPVCEEAVAEDKSEERPVEIPTGRERILFVDDEHDIVELAAVQLRRLGYSVTPCGGSIEAIALFRRDPFDFDLVVTDMTMPNLTGVELAQTVTRIRPGIPILLCSGYTRSIDPEEAKKAGITRSLDKPVGIATLAKAIREILDETQRPALRER
jgi:PAS domain S-box-containing protein